MLIITIMTFIVVLLIGMPVAFALGFSSLIAFLYKGLPIQIIVQRMFMSLDSFPLMAVPLFIFAGEIMKRSGLITGLMKFCDTLVGHITGGVGHVNVLASMFFGGMTGAAVADTSALGPVEIEMMTESGYDREYSTALTTASSIIGPVIPPSIPMVLYGVTAGVSIGALFLGGMIPGILLGIGLMIGGYVYSRIRNYPKREEKLSLSEIIDGLKSGILSIGMPLIVIGGIIGGIVTPTEAAAVAVIYALFVGVIIEHNLNWKELKSSLIGTGITTATVFIVLSAAGVVSYIITTQQVSARIGSYLASVDMSPYLFLLIVNIILLFIGCFLDTGAAIIIFAPILVPLAETMGINSIHFGVVMVLNLVIALATPPVGAVLYVACRVGDISIERLVKEIWPFLLINIIVLLFVTYIPVLVTYVPELVGFSY